MRFYVPEWDDSVDANYDFIHDAHSSLYPKNRDLAYIWDIFDHETTPIDGVLISREQVEDTPSKFDRLTSDGVYDDPVLNIPDWLPTISDCGAWGYKSLPFPPYGNEEMLKFYETLDVTAGVTIDHLVLGSGHTSRLYLDERAFPDGFKKSDISDKVSDEVDIMIDEWPEEWPDYVRNFEPSICEVNGIHSFDPALFDQSFDSLLSELESHPHALYRDDDMTFRYDLTLSNAKEMQELYAEGDYSFRLMAAAQGWNARSYAEAAERILDAGYQYIGVGGIAGSPQNAVEDYVAAVGNVVKDFERQHETRVDTHVFGFAKAGSFETAGRSGVSSFDSASMLRAAWTGGENYHLDSNNRYDAIRVRYPPNTANLREAVERSLRGQELLYALRAFDTDRSISTALNNWYKSASTAIENLKAYLRNCRHDERYEQSLLRDIEDALQEDYRYGLKLTPNFSGNFVSRLTKLLRKDNPETPVPFENYQTIINDVQYVIDDWTPTKIDEIRLREERSGDYGTFDQLWILVADYAGHVDDQDHLKAYEKLLRREPWRECDCPICRNLGIEIAIFRGNNRNRRRGFHNMRRFYDEFDRSLPKIALLTRGETELSGAKTTEQFLRENRPDFWSAVHDLPVVEIGVATDDYIYEWWEKPPSSGCSTWPPRESLVEKCRRYQELFIDGSKWTPDKDLIRGVREAGCEVNVIDEPEELRTAILSRLGYGQDFVPISVQQSGITDY